MNTTLPVQIEHLTVTPGSRQEPLRASAAGATTSTRPHTSSSARRRIEPLNTPRSEMMRLAGGVAVREAVERDVAERLEADDVAAVVEDPLGLAPVLDEPRVAARVALHLERHGLTRPQRRVGAEHVLVGGVLERVAVEVEHARGHVAQGHALVAAAPHGAQRERAL